MEANGFRESGRSITNQSNTRLALPVLFNGRHLSSLNPVADLTDHGEIFPGPGRSGAVSLLHDAGYWVTFIAPGFEHIGLRGGADTYLDVGPRNELEQALLSGTGVGIALETLVGGYLGSTYSRTLGEVAALKSVAATPSFHPDFVYVHIPVPHWPIVFDARCGFREADEHSFGSPSRRAHAGDAISIGAVADQTRCVDLLLIDAVEAIVEARPDSVILVLSDHGPEERIDWWQPSEPGISDRMSNLFWARTPGRDGLFPDDISLVNVMPSLFNGYLGTSLPMQENTAFLGPSNVNDVVIPYTPPRP